MKGELAVGSHTKVSRPKSPVPHQRHSGQGTIRDPHYTEYDMQKERNIQNLHPRKP